MEDNRFGPGCEHCAGFGRVTRGRGEPTNRTFADPCKHCGFGNFPGTVAGRLVRALGEPTERERVEDDERWSWGGEAFAMLCRDDENIGMVEVPDAKGEMKAIRRISYDPRPEASLIPLHIAVNLLRARRSMTPTAAGRAA